jgi:monofunctional glycosyltransferase
MNSPTTRPTPPRSIRKRLGVGVLLLCALPVALWAVHPWPILLRWVDPSTTAYMEHRVRAAETRGESLGLVRHWLPLDSVPLHLVQAVLVAEDDRFREHRGVDWQAVAEETGYRGGIPPDLRDPGDREALRDAVHRVRENREGIRGRSTLTQQLARNLYLSPDRSFIRKGQELLLARRLEFFLSKDRILELYLNVVELGPGIFGVDAASRTYFGHSASRISQVEAAALAATLPHPLTSNPAHNPGRMAWRRDLILSRLRGGDRPIPPPEVIEVDPPELAPPSPVELDGPTLEPIEPIPDTIEPDTVPSDTLRTDTIPGDTLPRGDVVPADTLVRDSVLPGDQPLAGRMGVRPEFAPLLASAPPGGPGP